MVHDAERYKDVKKRVEARNSLEKYCHNGRGVQLGIRVRYNNVLAENRLRQKINAHNECAQGQTSDGQAA